MMPQIHVYDDDLKMLKAVDNAETLTWNRRWRGIDDWSLTINAHKSNADYFLEDGYVGYYREGQYRLGIIEYPQLVTGDKPSKDVWTFQGRGIEALLSRRILRNFQALGTEYDPIAAGTARETAMRHCVNVEAVAPSISSRAIPHLSLEATDRARGGALTADYQGRTQVLTDVITDLCTTDFPNALGWDVLYTPANPPTGPGSLTFRVLSPRDKTMVKFSGQFQSIKGSTYDHNLMDYENAAFVGGSGSGTSRVFREVIFYELKYDNGTRAFTVGKTLTGGTSHATATIMTVSGTTASGTVALYGLSGTFSDNETITDNNSPAGSAQANGTATTDAVGAKRREILIDESSYSTDAELDQQGATRLKDYAAVKSITAEYNPQGSFRYIRDFDLGDIVNVKIGPFASAVTAIVAIEESYQRSGEKVKLTFGTEKPDLIDLAIRNRKQYLAQVRK